MNILVIVALAVAILGFVLATLVISNKIDEIAIFAALTAIMLGLGITVGTITDNTQRVNEIHIAAKRQDIAVTVSSWQQIPRTIEPCNVKLRFDTIRRRLLLGKSNTAATPEALEALCAK